MTKGASRFSLVLIAIAVCLSPLFGQVDENALRNKFGPPANGVFQVRPNITLSVTYGENHKICKLELRSTPTAPVIPVSLVQELVNEIVPPSTRGTAGPGGVTCAGWCWQFLDYANVTIGQAGTDVLPNPYSKTPNSLAVIRVKSCQAPKAENWLNSSSDLGLKFKPGEIILNQPNECAAMPDFPCDCYILVAVCSPSLQDSDHS